MVETYLDFMSKLCGAIRDLLTPYGRFGIHDPLVARWQRALSILGMIVVVSISIAFKGVDIGGLGKAFGTKVDSMVPNAGLALVAVVVGMVVLLVAAAPGERERMARSLGRPAATVAGVGFAAVVLELLFMLTKGVMGLATAPRHWYLFLFGLGAGFALIALMVLFIIPLSLWAAWLCVRRWCNAADGHPMLPWLTTIVFAAQTWALSIHSALTSGFGPPVPPFISACATLGGPPVMAVLSGLAIQRLRATGISFRLVPAQRTVDPPWNAWADSLMDRDEDARCPEPPYQP